MPILGIVASSKTKGVKFTQSTLPASRKWDSVAYDDGHGVWAVSASGTNAAATSTDGLTWTARTISRVVDYVGAGPNFLAAVIYNGNPADGSYSSDGGVSWTNMTFPMPFAYPMAKNSTYMVLISHLGTIALRSTNGYTWTASTLPASVYWNGIGWSGSVFAAVAGNATNSAAYSSDGVTWTGTTMPASGNWDGAIWDGASKFIAYLDNVATSATSPDGITWTQFTGTRVGGAALGDTLYTAQFTGGTYTSIYKTTDTGATWTAVPLGFTIVTAGFGVQRYAQNTAKNKAVFANYDPYAARNDAVLMEI